MGKEWINKSAELRELAKGNKDFYAFAFDDPFFVMDKTDIKNAEYDFLDQKQWDYLTLMVLDVFYNCKGKVLVITEYEYVDIFRAHFRNYYNMLLGKSENSCGLKDKLDISITSAQSLKKYQNREYELIVIDKVEKYVDPMALRSVELKKLKAKRVLATIHKRNLITCDFDAEYESKTFRNFDTKNNPSINAAIIALEILKNASPQIVNEKKFKILEKTADTLQIQNTAISAAICGIMKNPKKDLFGKGIDEESVKEIAKEMCDNRDCYSKHIKKFLAGRYVFSFGVEFYKYEAVKEKELFNIGKLKFNMLRLYNFYTGFIGGEEIKMSNAEGEEFCENYWKFLNGEA